MLCRCWTWFATFLFVVAVISACVFEDYSATCTDLIAGVPVKTTVVFHKCHDPIDVTFYVRSTEPLIQWQYTFVTSNRDERREISGLARKVALHVKLTNGEDVRNVLVQANYEVDNAGEQSFLNCAVHAGNPATCFTQGGNVLARVIVLLVLASVASAAIYLFHRFRKNADQQDQLALVGDAEVGLPGARPYQLEATSPEKKRCRYSLREHFHLIVLEGNV